MNTLFEQLCQHYNQAPDRHGEVYIACPFCGVESRRSHVHCSFSAKGFKCFVCGRGCGLRALAEQAGIETGEPGRLEHIHYKDEKPKKPPSWMATPEVFVRRYESHPRRYELWDGYKRLPRAVIEERRLGVGSLPEFSSHCCHERLIVPVICGTMTPGTNAPGVIVGLRGRALGCSCGKWLQAGGTSLSMLPLYNAERIACMQVIMIVENPVDALMISAYTPYHGVATFSVTYWQEAWTEVLRAARPELVVVAYDNDLPGNGGGRRRAELERRWFAEHPRAAAIPPARGPALANTLLAAGLRAVLFDWGEAAVKDVGGLLQNAPGSLQEGSGGPLLPKKVISYGSFVPGTIVPFAGG